MQLPNFAEKVSNYTKQHTNLKQKKNTLISYGLWVIIYDFDDSKSDKTIHSNSDTPPPSLSAYGILSTEISNHKIFRFTTTLDIKPKIPVAFNGVISGFLYTCGLIVLQKKKALYPIRLRNNHIEKSIWLKGKVKLSFQTQ